MQWSYNGLDNSQTGYFAVDCGNHFTDSVTINRRYTVGWVI